MKKTVLWLILTACIMLVLPWLAVSCLGSNDSMIVCLCLFYIVNPLFSAVLGTSAGKSIKKHFLLPAVPALLYLAGAWFVFGSNDAAFYLYAAIYLALGIIAMLLSALRQKKKSA